MRLIDLDQPIFVPIIDESKGGIRYEMQMTVEELFQKFFDGNVPEVVDAIPVEWLEDKMFNSTREVSVSAWRVLNEWHPHDAQAWQKEQEAR